MNIIEESQLSSDVFSIIRKLISTRLFTDKGINQKHPTKNHLLVQTYLQSIYNGSFHTIVTTSSHKPGYLSPLTGSWKNIEKAILDSLPATFEKQFASATYFYNPYTGSSWFLSRVKPQYAMEIEIKQDTLTNLKKLEIASTSFRCSDIFCPLFDSCLRAKDIKNKYVGSSPFPRIDDVCKSYIKE